MALPRLFKPFQQTGGTGVHHLMTDWFRHDLGALVLQSEKAMLDRLLPSMFGYYLMQTGLGAPQPLADASAIHCKLYVCEEQHSSADYHCVVSRLDDIAVASESIDVAILHHSLDFSADPHATLREAARTVLPGGRILIVGFNPWSLWGLWRLFVKHGTQVPWGGNFISPFRLSDWLKLLDFHIEGCETTLYGLPTAHNNTNRFFGWLSWFGPRFWNQGGGIYVLAATKQVSTLTPIKPAFRTMHRSLVRIPMAGIDKPSTRKSWYPDGKQES